MNSLCNLLRHDDVSASNAARRRLLDRALRFEAAAERMRIGRYGHCIECGNPIDPSRLALLPEAECCVNCQIVAEQRTADSRQCRVAGTLP